MWEVGQEYGLSNRPRTAFHPLGFFLPFQLFVPATSWSILAFSFLTSFTFSQLLYFESLSVQNRFNFSELASEGPCRPAGHLVALLNSIEAWDGFAEKVCLETWSRWQQWQASCLWWVLAIWKGWLRPDCSERRQPGRDKPSATFLR